MHTSHKKTKVLFVIPNLGPGGAERVALGLLENLDRKTVEASAVFYDSNHACQIPNGLKTYVLDLPVTRNLRQVTRFIKRVIRIGKIINIEDPDVILSFMNRVNVCVILAKLLSRNDSKLIISERTTPSVELSGTLETSQAIVEKVVDRIADSAVRFLIRLLYPKADRVVAVSQGVKKDLVEVFRVPEKNVEVIRNPLAIEKIQQLAQERAAEHHWFAEKIPIIINAGRLSGEKGQNYLVEAFKIVRQQANSRLVVLGQGEKEEELKKLVVDLGLANDVAFLGFQTNPFKFMAKANVFVLSSVWEGFPNALLEAMACGVPVVSTDCRSGPNEIIQNRINGILVPVKDVTKLAEAIVTVLQDKALALSMVEDALGSVEKYSTHRIVKEYAELIETLAS